MATTTGIWNHALAAGQGLGRANPMDSSSGGANSNSTSDSATISANDFLTLLVTEMQNQDPTATTDPNEYINQLVNVNSLEQLISINQNLSTALGTSPTGDAVNGSNGNAALYTATPANTSTSSIHSEPVRSTSQGSTIEQVSGNLSVPATNAAAERVAQALGGHP